MQLWIRALLAAGATACGRVGFDAVDTGDAGGIDPTLIAWYPLDDAPAYRDATGHASAAMCNGAGLLCPSVTTGPHGGMAARFDGTSQCLQITPGIDLAPPYTIALWARPERIPGFFENFVGRPYGASTEDTYGIDLYMDQTAEFFSPTQQHLHGTIQLAINAWVHVAATFDGTIKRLYVAGVQDVSAGFSGAMPSDVHPTYFGCDDDSGSLDGYLQGSLADVRFYARVLAATEIATLAAP